MAMMSKATSNIIPNATRTFDISTNGAISDPTVSR